MNTAELIDAIGTEKLEKLLKELPRKAQRAAIKEAGTRKRRGLLVNPRKQREKELAALKDQILKGGEEAADALIYGWLTSKRWPMLADFLDFFNCAHRQGLTNEDLSFLESISDDRLQEIADRLVQKYGAEDAAIYLHYLGHKNDVVLVKRIPELATIYPEPERPEEEGKDEDEDGSDTQRATEEEEGSGEGTA